MRCLSILACALWWCPAALWCGPSVARAQDAPPAASPVAAGHGSDASPPKADATGGAAASPAEVEEAVEAFAGLVAASGAAKTAVDIAGLGGVAWAASAGASVALRRRARKRGHGDAHAKEVRDVAVPAAGFGAALVVGLAAAGVFGAPVAAAAGVVLAASTSGLLARLVHVVGRRGRAKEA